MRYNLSAPAPYGLATIASLFGGVTDVSEAEQMGEWEFNRHPVMNGAYSVDEWVPGSHITLKRNEYFHTNNPALENQDAANFETIMIRFIPDADERLREVEAGNVDLAYHAPTNRWSSLEADPAYHVWSYQQPGVCYLNLQTDRGVLKDIRVRQALTYAVDRDAINAALGGVVTPSYGFLVPAQASYSAEEEAKLAGELKYDPARAKALLAEAGWKDSNGDGLLEKGSEVLRFDLFIPSDRANFKTAGPVLVEQFAAIGADAQLQYYDADYIKELMRSGEYDVGSRAFEWNDADILYWCFTEDSGYRWDDPELTELLTAARLTNDPEERVEAYVAVSDRLAEDFKAISLFSDNYIIVSRAEIDGLKLALDDRAWFSDVTVADLRH